MSAIDLQRLASIMGRSNGYLTVNRDNQLELKGTTFIGRAVHWVRFKFNRSYRQSISDAKERVVNTLVSDDTYGTDFQDKLNSNLEDKFLSDSKPLRARKVRLFIEQVMDERDSSVKSATDFVNWFSGAGGSTESKDNFSERCDDALAEKMKDVQGGLKIDDIDTSTLQQEVHAAALNDIPALSTIKNRKQAQTHVDKVLSVALDRHIDEARLKLHNRLIRALEDVGLPTRQESELADKIIDGKITTSKELMAVVNELVLKQIDDKFDSLLEQVMAHQGVDEPFAPSPEVKERVQANLAEHSQSQMLSVNTARKQAAAVLTQWVTGKKEVLEVIKPSPFNSAYALMKEMVEQNPYVNKAEAEAMQQGVNKAITEAYVKDKDAYESLGINKEKFLSKLLQHEHKEVLLGKFKELLQQKPGSLSERSSQLGTDAETTVSDFIKTLYAPVVENYKKVVALKEQIPKEYYKVLLEKIQQGHTWDYDFVSEINQLYIHSLTSNNYKGYYKVLQSPQVAEKRIGSKANLEHFTLNELIKKVSDNSTTESTAASLKSSMKSSMRKASHTRQMIDKVIPMPVRGTLLENLQSQLTKVRSRVMNQADAEALFQRGILRFLRDQKISFETMKMTSSKESRVI